MQEFELQVYISYTGSKRVEKDNVLCYRSPLHIRWSSAWCANGLLLSM